MMMFHKKVQLKDYQIENVEFVEKNKFVLIADEMGLGKTISALAVVQRNSLYPCLVICPKQLRNNWYREIKRMDHYSTADIVKGNDHEIKTKNGMFEKNYTIVNFDSHKLIKKMPHAKSIIIDEIHYLKNYKAKRTEIISNYVNQNKSSHVMGLSGTPILNKGTEIISVVNSIHKDLIDFWDFINNYCYEGEWGGYFVKPSKVVAINEMLKEKGIMIRHTKDVLDLPEKLRKYVTLEKPNGYDKKLRDLYLQYDEINIAALMKIRQWLEIKKSDDIVRYTQDVIEETDDKVIVFTNFQDSTEIIAKKMQCEFIHGDVTDEDRKNILSRFENDKFKKCLVMTIKTGNVGLNMTHAKHVIFAGFSYSPSDMMQAEDRIHRIGQEQDVIIHYLYSDKTVDEDAVELLTEKVKFLNGIIDGEKFDKPDNSIHKSIIKKLNEMFKEFEK